jgi:hypothetical protein
MNAKEGWQALLAKARTLKGRSGEVLWQRATMLRRVYEDEGWLAQVRSQGKNPVREMGAEVNDTPWSFSDLLVMLQKFPKKSDWAAGDLRRMHEETIARAKPAQIGGTSPAAERLSWKQKYLELKARYERLEQDNVSLRREVNDLKEILQGRRRGRSAS